VIRSSAPPAAAGFAGRSFLSVRQLQVEMETASNFVLAESDLRR
jgi:hypothetical protein